MIVDLILCKNKNFCVQLQNFENSLERDKILNFLHNIDIQISYVVLIFQNVWSYRSMESFQITTDCSVFDEFVFILLFAYFDESMSSIGGYEPW